jgi:hypothetical protein
MSARNDEAVASRELGVLAVRVHEIYAVAKRHPPIRWVRGVHHVRVLYTEDGIHYVFFSELVPAADTVMNIRVHEPGALGFGKGVVVAIDMGPEVADTRTYDTELHLSREILKDLNRVSR